MNFALGARPLTAVISLAVLLLQLEGSHSVSPSSVSGSGADFNTSSGLTPHHVPEFTLNELRSGSKDGELKRVLASTGLLAVRIPVHDEDNYNYYGNLLQGLCDCSATADARANSNSNGNNNSFSSIANADEFLLADGRTMRRTIATATLGTDRPLPLPKEDIVTQCYRGSDDYHGGNNKYAIQKYHDLEQARDFVSQAASGAFLPALDRLIQHAAVEGEDKDTITTGHGRDQNTSQHTLLTTRLGHNYPTVSSIIEDAVNLEHFHAYSHSRGNDNENPEIERSAALDWHTDGGLFLAFLPGKQCHENQHNSENEEAVDPSFRIKIPDSDQEYHPVIFPSSASSSLHGNNDIVVAIMLGYGAEHWLHTPPDVKLRATKHAVVMQHSQTRVWYGMMHLVPTDAIVDSDHHGATNRNSNQNGNMTFGELKKTSSTHSRSRRFGDDTSLPNDAVILGCGTGVEEDVFSGSSSSASASASASASESAPSPPFTSTYRRRRLQHVGGQDDCKKSNNFFCWLSCLDVPSDDGGKSIQEHVDDGKSLYCLDPSVLASTQDVALAVAECSDSITNEAGGVMNEACGNYWLDTVDGIQSYTDVYRRGNDADGGDDDLYEKKYCYGATSMYMQGFEWEGTTCVVYLFSPWVITTRLALFGACIGTILFGVLTEYVIRKRRVLLGKIQKGGKKLAWSAVLYGTQLTLGYLLMLVVMTYSGPLVISVVIGLVLGHVICNWTDVMGENGSGDINLEGSTPCCQNIIEEGTDDNQHGGSALKVSEIALSSNESDTDRGSACCA